MRKILHIAESADGGGAESVFRETVLSLNGNSYYSQLVACMTDSTSPLKADLNFSNFRRSKWNLILSQIFNIRVFFLLSNFLKKNKPDIIHIQNYGNLSPSVLLAIKKYKNSNSVKVIHTVHTFEYICSHFAAYDYKKNERCSDCIKDKIRYKVFYRGCSRAGVLHSWGKGITALLADYFKKGLIDKWIVPSEFLGYYMTERTGQRPTVIRNPIVFQIENNLNIKKNNKLVYFGRFSEEKNLVLLINAVKKVIQKFKINKLEVLLIGKGTQMLELENLVKSNELTDVIKFVPFLQPNELRSEVSDAKAMILPSKCFETFGQTICESIALGVLPIVAGHGAMSETVDWLDCGVKFISDDVNSLTEQIYNVLTNYDKYDEKIAVAQEKIEVELGRKKYASEILSLYNSFYND